MELNNGSQGCIAKLAGSGGVATASCVIANQGPGTHNLAAYYLPNPTFGSSVSPKKLLTIKKANSKTFLKLSTKQVREGQEQLERFSVTVLPQFTSIEPSGSVAIKSSSTTPLQDFFEAW